MESGINNKKLKVVWLCHFANQEMQDYFRTPHVKEMAPWINVLDRRISRKSRYRTFI